MNLMGLQATTMGYQVDAQGRIVGQMWSTKAKWSWIHGNGSLVPFGHLHIWPKESDPDTVLWRECISVQGSLEGGQMISFGITLSAP